MWQLAAGTLAMLAAAGWWIAIVALTPASARPYIGGSTDNSVLGLAFGYNGLGRITGHETGSVGGGTGGFGWGGATGISRRFSAEMGGQAGWLIPAALVALVGIGAATAWRERRSWLARGVLAAMIAVSVACSYVLLSRSASWYPWLRGLVVVAGLGAVIGVLARESLARITGPLSRRTATAAAGAVAVLALTAGLAGPAAYSVRTAATAHTGAIPSAGPAVTAASGPRGLGGRAGPGVQRDTCLAARVFPAQ